MFKFYPKMIIHLLKKLIDMCIDYDVMGSDYNMENNQDYRRCKNKTYNGTDFCEKHQNCTSFLSQSLNGYERPFLPNEWSHPYVEGT